MVNESFAGSPRSLRRLLWRIVIVAVLPTTMLTACLGYWLWQRERERMLQGLLETTHAAALAVLKG